MWLFVNIAFELGRASKNTDWKFVKNLILYENYFCRIYFFFLILLSVLYLDPNIQESMSRIRSSLAVQPTGSKDDLQTCVNNLLLFYQLLIHMPFPKYQLFVQFHSVDLCTEYRVFSFEENWILKVKAVPEGWNHENSLPPFEYLERPKECYTYIQLMKIWLIFPSEMKVLIKTKRTLLFCLTFLWKTEGAFVFVIFCLMSNYFQNWKLLSPLLSEECVCNLKSKVF